MAEKADFSKEKSTVSTVINQIDFFSLLFIKHQSYLMTLII